MAKVMVSLPDQLLRRVDAEAKRSGTSRSAILRGYADAALSRARQQRSTELQKLLQDAGPHGGDSAARVKATRPSP
jgi:metal-responsive CopG/Arc/MetJ family transcriptional regulator